MATGDGHRRWPAEEAENELSKASAKRWLAEEKEMLRRLPAKK